MRFSLSAFWRPFFFRLFILLPLLQGGAAFAQESAQGFGIEANIVGGRIFKHTKRFTGPIPDFSGLLDLNLFWKTSGKKDWQIRRHRPTVGLGFALNYYDAQNYGQSIGVYPNLQLPLLQKKDWEWTIRFGMGLGVINQYHRPFAPYWDTLNNAMGARVNNFSLLSSDLRYHLNKNIDLQVGITFTHMSSARFRLPNLGINLLGLHAGVRYFPQAKKVKLEVPHRSVEALPNRMLLQVRQSLSMTTSESIGSALTPVVVSSIALSKRYWSHNKVWVGADYGYHQSVYDFMRLQAIYPNNERNNAWNLALFAGHEFLYGRVGLYLQMGVYLRQTMLAKAPIYQRLGMNWYIRQQEKGFIKDVYFSTLLKTHYATAEYAEAGVGIGF